MTACLIHLKKFQDNKPTKFSHETINFRLYLIQFRRLCAADVAIKLRFAEISASFRESEHNQRECR